MAREKPFCQYAPTWVKSRLQKRDALAPLTGQDWPALQAFFHLVHLWGNSDEWGRQHAVVAMAHTVAAMQPETRHLAKAGIPGVLDWSHEDQLWGQIVNAVPAHAPHARLRLELLTVRSFAKPYGCVSG